jgi:hypothetical protein
MALDTMVEGRSLARVRAMEARARFALSLSALSLLATSVACGPPPAPKNTPIDGEAPRQPDWFTPPPRVLPKAAVETIDDPARLPRADGDGPAPVLPSFVGAQGFGAKATGGRGGKIVKVTTLAPSGPGSLQAALDLPGPRIVVFAVSGVIVGDVVLRQGDVTIAGQTAPGAGITIQGRLHQDPSRRVKNVVMRHVRVRSPYDGSPGELFDTLGLQNADVVMIDHCSFSWGVDDVVDLSNATDVTVQWSTIAESATVGHPRGQRNHGLMAGKNSRKITLHHDLFAHHGNRAPAMASGPAEMKNVVVYNVRHAFVHHDPASGPFSIVGNVFIQGPNDSLFPFYLKSDAPTPGPGLSYWFKDNLIDDPGELTAVVQDPFTQLVHPSFGPKMEAVAPPELIRARAEPSFASHLGYVPVTVEPPERARESVLAGAGAFPRDVVTRRVVADVRARTGSWGARPAPNLMEGLSPGAPPPDGDGDGMDDTWETSKGLDPRSAADAHRPLDGGWPAVEVYLQHLSDRLVAAGR